MGSDGRHNGMQGRTARFLDYLKAEKRYSPLTVEAYRRDLAEFSAYVQETFGDETWEEADRLRLRSYVAWLAERKIAPYSIRRKVSALRSFFRYEMKAGRLAANPALRLPMPKPGKRLVFFVEEGGMARLDREEGGAVAAGRGGAGQLSGQLLGQTLGQTSGQTELSSG
ncbi:MAG: site-specific integrase, partial [Bacteroidales bacterium]|nr:site-specific integrase [Bacteroidales bacterium]